MRDRVRQCLPLLCAFLLLSTLPAFAHAEKSQADGFIFVLVALGSAFVVALKQPWMRIAVRIVGSWIAASGLLMLGRSLR